MDEFQFVVGSGVALEFVIDGDMKAQLTNTLDMSSKKWEGGEEY